MSSPPGWSSLETIQSALNEKKNRGEDDFSKTSSFVSCESNNPACSICNAQSKRRRTRKKLEESKSTEYGQMKTRGSQDVDRHSQLEPNVKELFSFIENVLSSWFVEDGAYTSSQGDSENDDRSRSVNQESDEGEKSKTDEDDVFQITIEKHKKEKRKPRKMNDKDFKEISLEFDCG